MVNDQLINYIKTQLTSGYTKQSLIPVLLQSGYDQKTIDEAFNSIKKPNISKNMIMTITIIIIIILVIITGILIIPLFTQNSKVEQVRERTTPQITQPTPIIEKPQQQITQIIEKASQEKTPEKQTINKDVITEINQIVEIGETNIDRSKKLCNEVFSDTKEIDLCKFQVGINHNNAESCIEITNPEQKDSCFLRVALQKPERAACGQVSDISLQETCFNIVR